MNRRDFLRTGMGSLAVAAAPTVGKASDNVPAFAKGAVELEPILKSATVSIRICTHVLSRLSLV